MPFIFRDVALNPLIRGLHNLTHILTKGEAHAIAAGIDPNEYINGRLAPDMFTLSEQIHYATKELELLVSRITGVESLSLPDVETTFPELLARVKKTVEYLEGIDASAFEGLEEKEVVFHTNGLPGSGIRFEGRFEAKDYVMYFAHPNFWFHVTTAYGILRHKGVDLGKIDFLHGAMLDSIKVVPVEEK
ncbi:hypothetical protein K504DRAFT_466572 [Pleomassaria siparia CBS 279.74]|uniref:Uncharacterized protein n=1 Tax=Pleomassaria siparia CBS 279.74 TaxID=1314801 RepID=A0A6G1KB92_9PLEO|nr:hypothetical protein K504DRAFT_466572 [Pleomassaria siparia CBS 279.74]